MNYNYAITKKWLTIQLYYYCPGENSFCCKKNAAKDKTVHVYANTHTRERERVGETDARIFIRVLSKEMAIITINLQSSRTSRTSSTHLLPLALYHLIWRQPSSNLCWKSHHLTKTFWKTTVPFLTYLFCPKFLKKSFSTNISPISKKTTSAIPFSQPIEQDAALRPLCYVL